MRAQTYRGAEHVGSGETRAAGRSEPAWRIPVQHEVWLITGPPETHDVRFYDPWASPRPSRTIRSTLPCRPRFVGGTNRERIHAVGWYLNAVVAKSFVGLA